MPWLVEVRVAMVAISAAQENDMRGIVLCPLEHHMTIVRFLLVNAPVQLIHAVGELADQFVHLSLLLSDVVLSLRRLGSARSVRWSIVFFALSGGFTGHVVHNVVVGLDVLVDLRTEVESAQWTLCFDLEPLYTTRLVEVVLLVAGENDNLVVGAEVDEAYDAVGHARVLLLVFLVTHLLQTLRIALQGKFPGLLRGFEQASLDVVHLAQNVAPTRRSVDDLPDLVH